MGGCFLFKQKTAYEMRISDWSSDVCSSDLLPRTLIEYCYKDDALGDPLVAEEHIACFNWCSQDELHDIQDMAIRINDFMSGMFAAVGIRLVDFKLEFGRLYEGDFSRIIRSEEHTSELQSLMRISYAVFCLNKKKNE